MKHRKIKERTAALLDKIDPPTDDELDRSKRIGVPVREMRRNDKLIAEANAKADAIEQGAAKLLQGFNEEPGDLVGDVHAANVIAFPGGPGRPINERVYDRAIPSRRGTALAFLEKKLQYYVQWDDGEKGYVHIDQLGAVPDGAA